MGSPESADALEWFLSGFSARDLAEPLLSVDEGSAGEAARATLRENRADVIGVRRNGRICGWLDQNALAGQTEVVSFQSLDPVTVVADSTPLNEVICLLNLHSRLLVRALGQIAGVISRSNIEKPPLRMWLFGLITISEQRVTRLLHHYYPADSWQQQLSAGRLAKAHELQTLRRSRGQNPELLDCLQFADKGRLVARSEALRNQTRFQSRAEVERFVQALQDLRNNLAHAQDISSDWDVIHELAANVHQIVCGRADPSAK